MFTFIIIVSEVLFQEHNVMRGTIVFLDTKEYVSLDLGTFIIPLDCPDHLYRHYKLKRESIP